MNRISGWAAVLQRGQTLAPPPFSHIARLVGSMLHVTFWSADMLTLPTALKTQATTSLSRWHRHQSLHSHNAGKPSIPNYIFPLISFFSI